MTDPIVTQSPVIITITNQKGGVAKTTTAVSLAHRLAMQSGDTLLIDLDPQGQSSVALGLDPAPGIFDLFVAEKPILNCIQMTGRERLLITPSNQKTKTASNLLYAQIANGETDRPRLVEMLRSVGLGFRWIVIDTPASGIFQELALAAAQHIIIPTACDYLCMDGVRNTLATMAKLERTDQNTIILPTLYDARSNESRQNFLLLSEAYGGAVAEPIPASTAVREAVAYGKTIWEYDNRGSETLPRVRGGYAALADRIAGGAL